MINLSFLFMWQYAVVSIQCDLLDWAYVGSECLHVSLLVCFPSGPLAVCLSAAATAPGAAPLSRSTWPRGSTPTPLRPAASRPPSSHRYRLGPASTRCFRQPATPACEGREEPPWPRAQRWEGVNTVLWRKIREVLLQKLEASRY